MSSPNLSAVSRITESDRVLDARILPSAATRVPTSVESLNYDHYLYGSWDEGWRGFVHFYRSNVEDDEGGALTWHREGVGAQHKSPKLHLSVEGSTGSGDRPGVTLAGRWFSSERWSLGATTQTMSTSTPVDAWRSGVFASEQSADTQFRRTANSRFSAGISQMSFSDGNDRVVHFARWSERWIERSTFRFETTLGLRITHNAGTSASYFNPDRDQTLSIDFTGEWPNWRHKGETLRQRLTLFGGSYWQPSVENGEVLGARYEQIYDIGPGQSLRYGVGREIRPYDGVRTGRSYANVSFGWRF